jgi:hypothetical protein
MNTEEHKDNINENREKITDNSCNAQKYKECYKFILKIMKNDYCINERLREELKDFTERFNINS